MSVAVGLWTHALVPGKKVSILPSADLKITNAALGHELADENGRTSVKLVFRKIVADQGEDDEDDENESDEVPTSTTFVCSLTPGKVEQAVLDIILMDEEEYQFEVAGKNTVYLTGYYIDQSSDQPPYDMGDDSEDDFDVEDAYDLREVSSDVEMHPDDLDGIDSDASRFEEVKEDASVPKASSKRPRDSDATSEKPASKAEKKSKKQKVSADGEKADTADKSEKKEKKEKAKDDKKPKERELPGGLKVKDSKVGTGPAAKKGQTLGMRYIGKLQNGKVFDSNTKGKPVGDRDACSGEVIKGWDEGLVGIQVGGERVLTVPPAMGYGKRGTEDIPGNSTLTFEVKCVKVN
ncbi:peptidylprolyl isomerase fpr3 [Paramarasmius palmivorus]|uniref:peptidylprolyl isomerase n=1 Tax=Paramarasmius palmivorus TaxID=297713 RepID=A0AAW0DLI7_9AGAR